MDAVIAAAARALAAGDPLGALNRVALRDDAPALALRGIALAQLGDLARAKTLLRQAARRFGAKQNSARARCVVAEAEIALAARDLHWPQAALAAARATLERSGDTRNAAHAHYLEIRRLVLIGRLDRAERLLADIDPVHLPPVLRAVHELALSGIAIRQVRATDAHAALDRAQRAARRARIPALTAEVERAAQLLDAPAARSIERGRERLLRLEDVEALFGSDAVIVDACRNAVRDRKTGVALARRPVLFALVRALAEAWPGDASRAALVARAFRAKRADESHRARLRVEIGRLRKLLRPIADLDATPRGFALLPHRARRVVVLARPVEDRNAAVLALLSDGEAWSSSALALALGTSQRQVQRALDALAAAHKVHAMGRARARRWSLPPLPGFATTLLLPAGFPSD